MKTATNLLCALLTAGFLGFAGVSSWAADEPVGIGFAQAEEGTWWCRDSESSQAFACALDKCRHAAGTQQCHATRWCAPAGWSGLMVAWLPEFHTTVIICGSSSETTVGSVLKALCDASEEFTRCDWVEVIDPDGKAVDVSDLTWPGPGISAPAE